LAGLKFILANRTQQCLVGTLEDVTATALIRDGIGHTVTVAGSKLSHPGIIQQAGINKNRELELAARETETYNLWTKSLDMYLFVF
jgi:hypothetical protein